MLNACNNNLWPAAQTAVDVTTISHFKTSFCLIQNFSNLYNRIKPVSLRRLKLSWQSLLIPHYLLLILVECMSYKNSVKWPRSSWAPVAQWLERPPVVREAMGSIVIGTRFFSLYMSYGRVRLIILSFSIIPTVSVTNLCFWGGVYRPPLDSRGILKLKKKKIKINGFDLEWMSRTVFAQSTSCRSFCNINSRHPLAWNKDRFLMVDKKRSSEMWFFMKQSGT